MGDKNGATISGREDVLIFADRAGLCQQAVARAPHGLVGSTKIVTKPATALTVEQLEAAVGTKSWDLIVFGYPLDPPRTNQVEDIIFQQSAVDKLAMVLLQTLLKRDGACKRLAVLTHDIFSVEEDSNAARGISGIMNSSMFGFCNTGRLEVEFPVQLIDVEILDDEALLPYIATELFRIATFGVNTVRLCYPWPRRDGIRLSRPSGRFVMRQIPSHSYEVANKEFEVPAEGVIGISGGNGALGLVMGEWLLKVAERQQQQSGGSYAPRFSIQFLSRSMKVSDLNMPRWNAIQAMALSLGVKVDQAKLDMSSQDGIDSWISSVAPKLVGFIHSAGVLQDGMLLNQTWEKFEAVYDGKHRAALRLHVSLERFANPSLKFLWLFSSTAVYGNRGQINYSASNSFLDGLARWRVSQGKPCCAIQWGAWGEVGMAATLDEVSRTRFMAGPQPYFTVAQGLEGLEAGLRTGLPGFSVFIINVPVFAAMLQNDETVLACYGRNFLSECLPTPWPSSQDPSMVYDIYRAYRYIVDPYRASCSEYYWNKMVKPSLPDEDSEEEKLSPFRDLAVY